MLKKLRLIILFILCLKKIKQLYKNRLVIDFIYDEDDELFAMEYGNQIYYYIKDQTENIVKIIDETGNTMVEYSYNGWGEVKVIYGSQTSVAALNPFLYKSYLYDVETQLFMVSSRYYLPRLCRWISPDSIEYLDPQSINGMNLYCYCMNNPVNKYDSTGHFGIGLTLLLIATGVGLAFGFGIEAAKQAYNGGIGTGI